MNMNRPKHVLEEPVATTVISHRFSHVVWGSVFAGVVMAMVVQLFLSVLGSGIGLSAVQHDGSNLQELGVGAIVWWIAAGTIAFFIAGWTSGRMAGIPRPLDGMMHGILAWGVTTIISVFVITSAMGVAIKGGVNMVKSGSQAIAAAAPQVGDAINNVIPPEYKPDTMEIQNEIRVTLDQRLQQPDQAPQVMQQLVPAVIALGSEQNQDANRQKVVTILTQNTNMTPQEADQTVDRWAQNAQQARVQLQQGAEVAKDKAVDASQAAGKMALATSVMLLLGILASGFGGMIGAPHWSEQEIV
jgi:hypothetical protein